MDLLVIVKSAQNQNGLRQNDYQRYCRYCARRIYRIRSSLKFTNHRKDFKKMPVTVERAAENPLYLHILVYKTEAYWAQAMNAKQRVTNK